MSITTYDTWKMDPTPENMSKVVQELEPTLNIEVQRYSGPKPLLRGRAKSLAIAAVKSYDPTRGAQLRSWVVTQLQPLTRYGQQLKPVHTSELASRQAAELHRLRTELSDDMGREPTPEELADHTGISVRRIQSLQKKVIPTVSESTFLEGSGDEESSSSLPGTQMPAVLDNAEALVYDSLTERDRSIYDWKTGKHGKAPLSNQMIAQRLGVTPALISQRSQQIAMQIRDLAQRRGV